MAINSERHARQGEAPPQRWKSKCGLGYDYPSTLPLTDDPRSVTCVQCMVLLGLRSLTEVQADIVKKIRRRP